MKQLLRTTLFFVILIISVRNGLKAQDLLDHRITLFTNSPRQNISGFIVDYTFDTLLMSPQNPLLSPNAWLYSPISTNNIIAIKYPVAIEKKTNAGNGALIGLALGMTVSLFLIREDDFSYNNLLFSSGPSFSRITKIGIPIAGAVLGSLVGMAFSTNGITYNTVLVRGRPEILRAQKEKIRQLNRFD